MTYKEHLAKAADGYRRLNLSEATLNKITKQDTIEKMHDTFMMCKMSTEDLNGMWGLIGVSIESSDSYYTKDGLEKALEELIKWLESRNV